MKFFGGKKIKKEIKPLEERVKEAGILFEEPSTNGYVEGELTGSGSSKEAAENNLLSRAQTYGITNIRDELIYSQKGKSHTVKAVMYRLAPEKETSTEPTDPVA